jgi:ribokinase
MKMIGVIGSTNIDVVMNVDLFTKPGQTQRCNSLNYFFGGKGANQAVAAAKLSGNKVYFCTSVGTDDYGRKIVSSFKEINIEGFEIDDSIETGKAFIEVSSLGENRIVVYSGANEKVSKDVIDRFLDRYIQSIDIVLIQNELPQESVDYAIGRLKESGKKIIYDPAPVEQTVLESLKGIDFITPNEIEFDYLYRETFNDVDENLSDTGKVMKLGGNGIIFADENNKEYFIKSYRVNVVDTTAAGDTFNGALAASYVSSGNVLESVNFANAAAAISVTRRGAQTSIPERPEVEKFIMGHVR